MIKVVRQNTGLGNKLFMFCLGRILAQEMGYALSADPIPGFPSTYKKVPGHSYPRFLGYPVEKIAQHVIDVRAILSNPTKRTIRVEWPAQGRYSYYAPYADLIKDQWLAVDGPLPPQHPEDVIIHVRRGDFVQLSKIDDKKGYVLPFSFYEKLLQKIPFRKLYISTDDPHDPFFFNFRKYDAAILSSEKNPKGGWNAYERGGINRFKKSETTLQDFKTIMSFNKIVLSPSTFGWWAAYLSKATEVYFPLPSQGTWSDKRPDVDLRVPEERYIYVDENANRCDIARNFVN